MGGGRYQFDGCGFLLLIILMCKYKFLMRSIDKKGLLGEVEQLCSFCVFIVTFKMLILEQRLDFQSTSTQNWRQNILFLFPTRTTLEAHCPR